MVGIKQRTDRSERRAKRKGKNDSHDSIGSSSFFRAIKPKERYVFHSDYFQIDQDYATVLAIIHDNVGADRKLSPFWGINLIPQGLDQQVSVRLRQQVTRKSRRWIDTHQGKSEKLLGAESGDISSQGSMSQKHKMSFRQEDLMMIAKELSNGDSYLDFSIRLLVKAPTLNALDEAVQKINRHYKAWFDGVQAAPFFGEQRKELANLVGSINEAPGKHLMMTSREFAGSYNLVTQGIEDKTGEYIGTLYGDVNSSALLMDIDKYDHHVVISNKAPMQTLSGFDFHGERGADAWGVKLAQAALMNNQRVVHFVLNGANVTDIGQDLSDITSVINLSEGDVNLFELFGDPEDELNLFAPHLNKIVLMTDQVYAANDDDRAAIQGSLNDVLREFYMDQNMWVDDAQNHRDQIRLVGLPHQDYPRLRDFTIYLRSRYDRMKQDRRSTNEELHAFATLKYAFDDMLANNGDLFDVITTTEIDRAKYGQRVVYEFSSLMDRSPSVAMAQFINILSYAINNLSHGDLIVLHGAELLNDTVKAYVSEQFERLFRKDIRVAYIYHDTDAMIGDLSFNRFDEADYTLIGGMSEQLLKRYNETLDIEIPKDLHNLLIHKENQRWYLRRGFNNIVFDCDILMGMTTRLY